MTRFAGLLLGELAKDEVISEVTRGQRSAEGSAEGSLLVVVGWCEEDEAAVVLQCPPL